MARRIEPGLQVKKETLRQAEALDELRRMVELQHARAEEAVELGKERNSECRKRRWRLSGDEARLQDVQRLLRKRQQQCMVALVAALYPVRVFHDQAHHAENRCQDANGEHGALEENRTVIGANGTHLPCVIKSAQVHALTVFGWQIMKSRTKQKSHNDRELQRSAAVLGYAAQVSLSTGQFCSEFPTSMFPSDIRCALEGPRSFVSDCLPSPETLSAASAQHLSVGNTVAQLTEYPLFLECEEDDSTSASYAIYLLHKDAGQLLNYIGVESSGTGRHVFGNLRELLRITHSAVLLVAVCAVLSSTAHRR